MCKIVINSLDVRGCYNSGIMKPLLIFNELRFDDHDKTFY